MTLRPPRALGIEGRNLWQAMALFFSASVVSSLAAGCKDSTAACYPKDVVACSCDSGADVGKAGIKQCATDGTAYGACDCTGALLDGGVQDAGVTYLASCKGNGDCESGLCFPFNSKGPKCTRNCTSGIDCPPPSPGCNNQGVCKVP